MWVFFAGRDLRDTIFDIMCQDKAHVEGDNMQGAKSKI
jgi:hypothetical protein